MLISALTVTFSDLALQILAGAIAGRALGGGALAS
jgi:hypothetical protein